MLRFRYGAHAVAHLQPCSRPWHQAVCEECGIRTPAAEPARFAAAPSHAADGCAPCRLPSTAPPDAGRWFRHESCPAKADPAPPASGYADAWLQNRVATLRPWPAPCARPESCSPPHRRPPARKSAELRRKCAHRPAVACGPPAAAPVHWPAPRQRGAAESWTMPRASPASHAGWRQSHFAWRRKCRADRLWRAGPGKCHGSNANAPASPAVAGPQARWGETAKESFH